MTLLHFYRWNGKHDVMLIRQPRVGGQDVEGSLKLDKFGGWAYFRSVGRWESPHILDRSFRTIFSSLISTFLLLFVISIT